MERDLALERQYLANTKAIATEQRDEQLRQAEQRNEAILAEQQEMREETWKSFVSLWDAENFEAMVELGQYSFQVQNEVNSYEAVVANVRRLERVIQSPYFARIDFLPRSKQTAMRVYIGRSALMHQFEMVVYDWRSPIAGMFYAYGVGGARYEAPSGTRAGEITLKRQFELKNGELEFFFDADVEIMDTFLRKLLSQNASAQMKSIVETIQRDQDEVVRDRSHDVVIVQGVAGSGKTSIALHRVAYLMYTGLTDNLTHQDIMVVSPHSLFEHYISNVLPELGEHAVTSLLLDEIFQAVLSKLTIQTRNEFLESALDERAFGWIPMAKRSLAFKTSRGFMRVLDALELSERNLRGVWQAYRALFEEDGRLERVLDADELPPDIASMIGYTRENLASQKLRYDDASALTYLALRHLGYDGYRHIKQVVIDEAQDYYEQHYRIFAMLFPLARFTILGDIHQTIEKQEDETLYASIQQTLGRRNSALVTLTKSFRCANEILDYSARLLGISIDTIGRAGEPPRVLRIERPGDIASLLRELEACGAAGCASVGILCKTQRRSEQLARKLARKAEVRLIDSDSCVALEGTLVMPIYLAKGLEFDAAIVWDADAELYGAPDDRKLLYIACTRALHRLVLFYSGQVSPHLPAQ